MLCMPRCSMSGRLWNDMEDLRKGSAHAIEVSSAAQATNKMLSCLAIVALEAQMRLMLWDDKPIVQRSTSCIYPVCRLRLFPPSCPSATPIPPAGHAEIHHGIYQEVEPRG